MVGFFFLPLFSSFLGALPMRLGTVGSWRYRGCLAAVARSWVWAPEPGSQSCWKVGQLPTGQLGLWLSPKPLQPVRSQARTRDPSPPPLPPLCPRLPPFLLLAARRFALRCLTRSSPLTEMHLMIPGCFSELVENEPQDAGFQRKGMQPVQVARNTVSVCR